MAPGKGDVEDLHAPLDEEREDLPRGRQPRRVAVVGDDDGRDLPGEEVGLRRRQRRPHRGDGPRDAGPLERDPVEVPLAEDELLALPRPLAGPVEAVEDLPLREAGGLGAVDVLGRVVAEGPAAEREDLAPRVADLEDQAVAEAVVDAPRVLVLLEEAGLEEDLLGEGPREGAQEAVPRVGGRPEAERLPLLAGDAAPLEDRLRRGVAGQLLAEELRGRQERLGGARLLRPVGAGAGAARPGSGFPRGRAR